MSLDSAKVKGSAKNENIFRESVRKEERIRVNWPNDWLWCVNLFREREKFIAEYKNSSPKALAFKEQEKPDERTIQPFPESTAQNYGWLSGKREFQLEIFGPCYFSPKQNPINPPEQ